MSKRDDRQWATNIAFHRSPLHPKPEKAEADTAKLTRKPKAKTDAKMAKEDTPTVPPSESRLKSLLKSDMKKRQVRIFLIFEFSRNTQLYRVFWSQATRHSRYEVKDSSRDEAYNSNSRSVRGYKQIADSDIVIVVAKPKLGKKELLSQREMSIARHLKKPIVRVEHIRRSSNLWWH